MPASSANRCRPTIRSVGTRAAPTSQRVRPRVQIHNSPRVAFSNSLADEQKRGGRDPQVAPELEQLLGAAPPPECPPGASTAYRSASSPIARGARGLCSWLHNQAAPPPVKRLAGAPHCGGTPNLDAFPADWLPLSPPWSLRGAHPPLPLGEPSHQLCTTRRATSRSTA